MNPFHAREEQARAEFEPLPMGRYTAIPISKRRAILVDVSGTSRRGQDPFHLYSLYAVDLNGVAAEPVPTYSWEDAFYYARQLSRRELERQLERLTGKS